MTEEIGELKTKEYGIMIIKDSLSLNLAITILKTIQAKQKSQGSGK